MEAVTDFLEQISAPEWVGIAVVAIFAFGMLGDALDKAIGAAKDATRGIASIARLLRKGPAERQRLRRRQRFAKDVRRKLQLLEGREWSDERFTELEAQVIIERTATSRFAVLNLLRPGRALRYQRSLTHALRNTDEELILLQGDPGCGKSVALRHVALVMAERAASSRSLDAVIPLYVNLKGLRRRGQSVDAELIQDYVNTTLRKDINADIERFLDEEYARGLTEGTWFLLFDSFDEIPEILGSSRIDETVREYSAAIATFLSGMRPCQGVVASREFHSPKGLPWPTWQIKPLTPKRQRTLVHRYLLDRDKEGVLLAGLQTAGSGIERDASNPLFLSLLAEYVRRNSGFPSSSHDVYEAYVEQRFDTDAQRVQERFAVTAADVRAVAEQIAFCMSDEEGIGLDPSRAELLAVLERRALAVGEVAMTCMDALEYLKLVHGQPNGSDPLARVFTFAHRRFQEYFTGAAVLDRVGEVSTVALLSDPRWRETAVTLCQLQRDSAAPLLQRADEILSEAAESVPSLTAEQHAEMARGGCAASADQLDEPWPTLTLEVLGILQAGFSSEPERLPVDVRQHAGRLLDHVFWRGLTYDRVAAVSVAAVAPSQTFDAIVRGAFKSGSQLLADQAYRQLARLRSLPVDLAAEIRRTLLRLCADRTLRREALTVSAQLKRFDTPRPLLRAQNLALAAPRVDLLVLAAILVPLVTADGNLRGFGVIVAVIALASHASLYRLAAALGSVSSIRPTREDFGLPSGWMTLILRGDLALLVFLAAGEGLNAWLKTALAALALAWAPAALVAVRRGEFLHPVAYPLALLSPAGMIGRVLRRQPPRQLLVGLVVATGYSAVIVVVVLASSAIPSSWSGIILAVSAGAGLLSVIPYAWQARHFLVDLLWYRRWDAPRTELSVSELRSLLGQVRTMRTATRMLADVRQGGLLEPVPEAFAFLADLARLGTLERTSRSQTWRTPDFGDWLETWPLARMTRGAFGSAFEDEVARLVQTLRERPVKRRTEAVATA
jgi:hypothetical protein